MGIWDISAAMALSPVPNDGHGPPDTSVPLGLAEAALGVWPIVGSAGRGRAHPPELGDPGASRLEVIKGCWAQDRTGGRTSSEKVTSTHDRDEFAGWPWSV
jgi:hypothetical protein